MTLYQINQEAARDLDSIYTYSILNFGLGTAREYFNGLIAAFEMLADNPKIGRIRDEISENLRSFVYKSHVVFYRPHNRGKSRIRIVRVMHASRDVTTLFH